jgi:chemotaxis protein MotA
MDIATGLGLLAGAAVLATLILLGGDLPAFGTIGTLIGMVQMFANMTDPSKLGPFMAVALLATFYGAAVANLLCLPIADKLHLKLADEEINRTLIIDGILMIREAKSPTLVREMLLAYLPEKHRHTEDEQSKEAEAVAAFVPSAAFRFFRVGFGAL